MSYGKRILIFSIFSSLILSYGLSYADNIKNANYAADALNVSAVSFFIPKNSLGLVNFKAGDFADFFYEEPKHKTWLFMRYSQAAVSDRGSAQASLLGFEAGYDRRVMTDKRDKYYIGLSAEYGAQGDISAKSLTESKSGSASFSYPAFSIYAAWRGENNYFAGLILKNYFESVNFKDSGFYGGALNYDFERNVSAFSGEFGKKIKYGFLEIAPKVSLALLHSGGASAQADGQEIKFEGISFFNFNAALQAGYRKEIKNKVVALPYFEAGLGYGFAGRTEIAYAGKEYVSDFSGASLNAALGLNVSFSQGITSYIRYEYESARYYEGFALILGIRYGFAARLSSKDEDYRNIVKINSISESDSDRLGDNTDFDEDIIELVQVEGSFTSLKFQSEKTFDQKDSVLTEPYFDLPADIETPKPPTAKKTPAKNTKPAVKLKAPNTALKPSKNANNVSKPKPSTNLQVSATAAETPNALPGRQSDGDSSFEDLYAEDYKEGTGKIITLGSSFFQAGQSEINESAEKYLKQIAAGLKEVKIKMIIVTGHTDAQGDGVDVLNEVISETRAKSVYDALIKYGISERNIKYRGEGSSKPIKQPKKKKGQKPSPSKPNRRVEIEIIE
ncbi:MAG: OmpA family protein [Endomicrobium sp.]|jgi:outer membrane protein OmpA-like peptidoglycan-associated protein|nr:OmpA family protein [Endomicrobium sp.]